MNLILWGLMLSACGDEVAIGEGSALGQQLRAQIGLSCEASVSSFQKEITNMKLNPPTKEDSSWNEIPMVSAGEAEDGSDSTRYMLWSELDWALKSFHDAPSLADYYELTSRKDTAVATLLSDYDRQSELKSQKMLYAPEGERLLYYQAYYDKENWLYSLSVMIEIYFDDQGRYDHHNLKVKNDISMLDSGFDAWIAGRIDYDE
ncbi:MAG: hypothetical protein AAFQ68_04885 [Bacteroidota bacterium]